MLFLLLVGLAFFLAMPVQVNLNSTLEAYWGRAGSGSTERPKISKRRPVTKPDKGEHSAERAVQRIRERGSLPSPQW